MMDFMDLVKPRNLMEQPMDHHVENVINNHCYPDLPDELTSLWERLGIIADFEPEKATHHY